MLRYSRKPPIKEEHACLQTPNERNVKTPSGYVGLGTLDNAFFFVVC